MNLRRQTTTLRTAFARGMRSDFGRDRATDEERAALAQSDSPITEALAQDYAAWRFSVLYLSAIVLAIGALLSLANLETISEGMVNAQYDAQMQAGNWPDEDLIRSETERTFGASNLDVLDLISWISLLATFVVAILVILSTRAWHDVRRSARTARRAWFVLVGTPLLLAILPWSRLLDFDHLDSQQADAVTSMLGIALGLSFFMVLAPKLISIFPGIIRASVSLKTMLHESPVPGYTVVLFAPVYAMFILVIFTTINQMQGNLTLLLGLGCLVVAPIIYIVRAREFLRPHTAEESATLVHSIRRQSFLFNVAGSCILIVFLADLEGVTVLDILQFFLTAGGGVLLMMVVAADLVLGLLRLEHQQAKVFVGSELASAFESKLETLAAVGGGEVIAATHREESGHPGADEPSDTASGPDSPG